jgi:hypothetical protein
LERGAGTSGRLCVIGATHCRDPLSRAAGRDRIHAGGNAMTPRSLLFLALLAVSCSPPGGGNQSSAGPAGADKPMVVTATSAGAGACSYSWNGEAVSEQGLLDKSVAAIEVAIERVGGIEKITEETMPVIHLQGPPETPYSCTGPALRQLERAGMVNVVVRPDGAYGMKAKFPIDPFEAGPFTIIRVGRDGMSWEGQPIDQAGLRERVKAERLNRPPVELAVAPAEDSTFRGLYETLAAVKQGEMEAILSGCAGTSGPVRESGPVC